LACGTAFFFEEEVQKYLVTNWHNLAGRHPKTRQVLDKNWGDVPNKIKIYKHDLKRLGQSDAIEIPLVNAGKRPVWFEHPIHGSNIDIGILPIAADQSQNVYSIDAAIKDIDPFDSLPINVGESVFVLGFPFGLSGSSYFPIWKAAIIASEPEIDINKLPFFYIDTATRQGMSGSPVMQREPRSVFIMEENKMSRYRCTFLGVYSGRIGAKDELAAQLGIVWKASCLLEIIDARKRATT
jgi:hypothetical protein